MDDEMDMLGDAGVSAVMIKANGDGSFSVMDAGESAEGEESQGQPAASIDEALSMAKEMLSGPEQSAQRANVAKEVYGNTPPPPPGELNRPMGMGRR